MDFLFLGDAPDIAEVGQSQSEVLAIRGRPRTKDALIGLIFFFDLVEPCSMHVHVIEEVEDAADDVVSAKRGQALKVGFVFKLFPADAGARGYYFEPVEVKVDLDLTSIDEIIPVPDGIGDGLAYCPIWVGKDFFGSDVELLYPGDAMALDVIDGEVELLEEVPLEFLDVAQDQSAFVVSREGGADQQGLAIVAGILEQQGPFAEVAVFVHESDGDQPIPRQFFVMHLVIGIEQVLEVGFVEYFVGHHGIVMNPLRIIDNVANLIGRGD